MTKTEFLHIRINPDIKKMIQELASSDHRSVSQEIEFLIMKEYEKRKEKDK
jgi:hypothetical protein